MDYYFLLLFNFNTNFNLNFRMYRLVFHFPFSVLRFPFSVLSACLCHDGFAFDAGDAAKTARQGVDAVDAAFDNKRNHRHSALLERQPLPTEDDVGKVRNDWIDKRRLASVGHENCYCSYSLFHQSIRFWIRFTISCIVSHFRNDATKIAIIFILAKNIFQSARTKSIYLRFRS